MGDAEQMFLNSVVEVEGVPIAIHGWAGDGEKMAGINILTGATVSLARDADLLLAPTRHQLGYQQVGSQAIFLQRRPVRQYRVGWCDRNVDGMNSARDLASLQALSGELQTNAQPRLSFHGSCLPAGCAEGNLSRFRPTVRCGLSWPLDLQGRASWYV